MVFGCMMKLNSSLIPIAMTTSLNRCMTAAAAAFMQRCRRRSFGFTRRCDEVKLEEGGEREGERHTHTHTHPDPHRVSVWIGVVMGCKGAQRPVVAHAAGAGAGRGEARVLTV